MFVSDVRNDGSWIFSFFFCYEFVNGVLMVMDVFCFLDLENCVIFLRC